MAEAQKKTNGGAGWLGRDPTAIDLVQRRPSWKKVNEIYKKYSRGQNMGELAMREITGLLWMADVINRAKSVEPAVLAKTANETNMGPEQLIIDYKGIKFENGQNVLATGVVTQVGWDGEKHTMWPWDLAVKANFKPIFPNPSWQEREASPSPRSEPSSLQAIVNGLEMGLLYALVAVGLTIIWGLMEMINFAHGELLMMGMFGAWWLSAAFGLDPLLGIVPMGWPCTAWACWSIGSSCGACRGRSLHPDLRHGGPALRAPERRCGRVHE